MPIAEIAREGTSQVPIDRAGAAVEWLLCRPDQDKAQTLLDRLEVGAQIKGATGGLSHDWHLWPTFEKKAPGVDGAIRTESETDLAAKLARDISLHALRGIRTEANGGHDGKAARLTLRDRERLRAAAAESGNETREKPGRTNSGHGLPTRGRMRQGSG
jgi:hypothetical protein